MDILEVLQLIRQNSDIQATDGKRNIFCNSFGAIQVKGTIDHFTLDVDAMQGEWEIVNEHWAEDTPQIVDEVEHNGFEIKIFQQRDGKHFYRIKEHGLRRFDPVTERFESANDAIKSAKGFLDNAIENGYFGKKVCEWLEINFKEALNHLFANKKVLENDRELERQDQYIVNATNRVEFALIEIDKALDAIREYKESLPKRTVTDEKEEVVRLLNELADKVRSNKLCVIEINREENFITDDNEIRIVSKYPIADESNIEHLEHVIDMIKSERITVTKHEARPGYISINYKKRAS